MTLLTQAMIDAVVEALKRSEGRSNLERAKEILIAVEKQAARKPDETG